MHNWIKSKPEILGNEKADRIVGNMYNIIYRHVQKVSRLKTYPKMENMLGSGGWTAF